MTDAAESKPRKSRSNFFLTATLSRIGKADFAGRIRNLSSGGMMIETTESLADGEPVVAELRGIGRVAGRVAWVRPPRAGIAFAVEIDPELARKPVCGGTATPDYVKPIIVVDRKVTAAAKIAPDTRLD